jgi:hypothetical protein
MELQHHLSPALRNSGPSYAADELDRLLAVLNAINIEVADNAGRVQPATQYQLSALIHEQSMDAEVPA